MLHRKFGHAFAALWIVLALLGQETWALAGTTGSINGTLANSTTGKPIADALITASSPSQTATAKTNASGRFSFISLAPDTYTVTAEDQGFNAVSVNGVAVFADQAQNLSLETQPVLRTIVNVTSRSAGNLVKSGTTSDVYSVNSATQATLASVGGGYNLNQAYSAIYSQPGVT